MRLHYISSQPDPITSSPRPETLTILVHGGALSSRMYRTLTPHLTSPWIAVDLPGHGKSVHLGPFTFATSTELLRRFIEDFLLQTPRTRHLDDNDENDTSEPQRTTAIALVGISLGGQAVLDLVLTHPQLVRTAVVSGVSIHPPDATAAWELPHMPTEQAWLDAMMEDVAVVGSDAAMGIQAVSFGFSLDNGDGGVDGRSSRLHNENQEDKEKHYYRYPPVLVCVGEQDVAMARRDFDELVARVTALNPRSEGWVVASAWYNHSIDVPEQFAGVVNRWIERIMELER